MDLTLLIFKTIPMGSIELKIFILFFDLCGDIVCVFIHYQVLRVHEKLTLIDILLLTMSKFSLGISIMTRNQKWAYVIHMIEKCVSRIWVAIEQEGTIVLIIQWLSLQTCFMDSKVLKVLTILVSFYSQSFIKLIAIGCYVAKQLLVSIRYLLRLAKLS